VKALVFEPIAKSVFSSTGAGSPSFRTTVTLQRDNLSSFTMATEIPGTSKVFITRRRRHPSQVASALSHGHVVQRMLNATVWRRKCRQVILVLLKSAVACVGEFRSVNQCTVSEIVAVSTVACGWTYLHTATFTLLLGDSSVFSELRFADFC